MTPLREKPLTDEESAIVLEFGKTSLYADFAYEMAHMILPLWILHLGGTAVTVSLMESIAEVSRMGGAMTAARTGDTPKRQGLLVQWGYGLTAVVTPLMGSVWGANALIVLKAISWYGKGLRGPARDALVTATIPREWLSRAFSRIQTLDQTGGIIGPLVATALTGTLPARLLLTLTAIPALLCVLSARSATRHTSRLTFGPEPTPTLAGSRETDQGPEEPNAPLPHGGWLGLLLGGTLLKISIFPATLLMFRFSEQGGQAIIMGVGFILSSLVHVGAGLFLSFRPIMARQKRDILPGPLALAIAMTLLLFPAPGSFEERGFYLAGMALWGAGELWTTVVVKTRVSRAMGGKRNKTKGFSQLDILTTAGLIAFQPAAAWGWEHGYTRIVLGITLTFLLAGTALLLFSKEGKREESI